jgi:hypothetical protein
MTSLKPGDYIVSDFVSFGRKEIRVHKLAEKGWTAYDTHKVSGTSYGSFEDLMKNGLKAGRPYTETKKAGMFSPGLDLPMNCWRIPDSAAQRFFDAMDTRIKKLESEISDLRTKKYEYAKEHRLEWDMPTLKDLKAFLSENKHREVTS